VAVAMSFSKNATLYKHRTGVLFVKASSDENADIIESHLKNIVRESISNLPGYGSEILAQIFSDPEKTVQWKAEVDAMRESLNKRKDLFVDALGDGFEHLKDTKGMFGLLGMSKEQVIKLKEKYAIYLPHNGRISFAGLETDKIDYIARCIKDVVRNNQ